MFACADCPRRVGKAPVTALADIDGSADVAAAFFLGEQACSIEGFASKKIQCLHPDKPLMFACADCPRRGSKALADTSVDLNDDAGVAVAAFLGEQACPGKGGASKKTQCLHPDKPIMFACSDCPRRGVKAPANALADLDDGAGVAVATFLGEDASFGQNSASKKTQGLHPDKPLMFACADCPRRDSKALADTSVDLNDGAGVAVAAFLGEQACPSKGVDSKKTQCLHPDKPLLFACADCPRRNSKVLVDASADVSSGTGVAVAAFLGEEGCAGQGTASKKTQCLHPDKPLVFACADCPRRGGKVLAGASADLDSGAGIAVAAFLGDQACPGQGGASKKAQCLHPDKPLLFACADCPRRGGKALVDASADMDGGAGIAVAALLAEQACFGPGSASKKTQCLHPDKPVMFACADCPRRSGKRALVEAEGGGSAGAAAVFTSEGAACAGRKSQCLHPDKPIMFACADCPRRDGKACTAA